MSTSSLTELFSDFAASSWRGAWLIVALVVLRVLVRGRIPAGVWFVAWIVVAVRLLIPFSVPVSWSPYNLTAARAPTALTPVPIELPAALPPSAGETALAIPVLPETASTPRVETPAPPDWRARLAFAWLAGVGVFLGARALASWRLRRELRRARDADPRIVTIVQREAARWGIRRAVACRETTAVDAPALFGLWRPQLLFPPTFATQLTDDELSLVVRHELAHWRRRDLLAQGMMQAAVALHWFNPLAWLAARLARADCELACDEFVLRREAAGGAQAYGSALLKVLGVVRGRRRPGAVVAILEGKQQLAHRVRMIAGYQGSTIGRVLGGGLLMALVAAASMTRESQAQEQLTAPTAAPALVSAPVTDPNPPVDQNRERILRQTKALEMLLATVDDQRKKVDALAQQLQTFKEKHNLGSLDRRKDMVSESLKAINLEVQRAGISLQTAETRLNQIKDYRANGADLTSLSFIANQPVIVELKQQLAGQRIATAKLQEAYRDSHPNMIGAKNAMAQTQRELERSVDTFCAQAEAEYQAALKNFQARRDDLERNKIESLQLDRLGVDYSRIEREFTTQNQILQSIVSRSREVRDLDPQAANPAQPNAEPLSVVFQKRPSGWVLTETRGDQGELAKSADQLQALKANLETAPVKSSPAPAPSAAPPDEFFVSVLGAVNAQGAVTLRETHKPIALDAIARAGGFAANADRKSVRLIRSDTSGTRTTSVLAEDVLMNGGGLLQPQDVIVVSAATAPTPTHANVGGAVNRAGRFELPAGQTVNILDLISLAGGATRLADLRKVKMTRRNPNGSVSTTIVDVDSLIKGNGADSLPTIAPGDGVFVPEKIL